MAGAIPSTQPIDAKITLAVEVATDDDSARTNGEAAYQEAMSTMPTKGNFPRPQCNEVWRQLADVVAMRPKLQLKLAETKEYFEALVNEAVLNQLGTASLDCIKMYLAGFGGTIACSN
jgi:hypothetical protein